MFWERDLLLEGEDERTVLHGYVTNSDDEPIDLAQQAGVYVLYAGADIPELRVVYVGQAGRGRANLLRRLKDHFSDRFWNRWTHFSWFGLYPIEDGEVEQSTDFEDLDVPEALNQIEALLITLFEPTLNLQGGRWKDTVEVFQWDHDEHDDDDDDDDDDEEDELTLEDLAERLDELTEAVKRLGKKR
jgi:hypothetical protein